MSACIRCLAFRSTNGKTILCSLSGKKSDRFKKWCTILFRISWDNPAGPFGKLELQDSTCGILKSTPSLLKYKSTD